MPLQSKLFKDDQKLQACLVNDAAHVTRVTFAAVESIRTGLPVQL